jgi:hypothetical protein
VEIAALGLNAYVLAANRHERLLRDILAGATYRQCAEMRGKPASEPDVVFAARTFRYTWPTCGGIPGRWVAKYEKGFQP